MRVVFFIGLFFFCGNLMAQKQDKPNVLFIAIDDLKPILGCYGNKMIHTPNIDRLAKMGTTFMRNYCQLAVCGPTRASMMTGMRPDITKVWDLNTTMRSVNPDIISLPQYFISQGYSSQGIGKVYDPRCVDKELDGPSWSVPYYKTDSKYYPPETGEPALSHYQSKETKLLVDKYLHDAAQKGMNKKEANEYAISKVRPTTECVDLPDNAYNDGANVLQARDILIGLKKKNNPFFFAVGIAKPHLPFVAPKKYWDLYKRADMPIAPYQEKSKNGVDMAYHSGSELQLYSDIPSLLSFTDQKDFGLSLPLEKQRELIHGYYAAISYTDALVGTLLNTLDSLGLSKNTIVVLWGDHGWHLGDHNLWCKHTNFEQATHAPLIISSPGMPSSTSYSSTEFVDVFPTLCELSHIPVPSNLNGKSLVPLMKDKSASVKEFSVSQYPRSSIKSETGRLGYVATNYMGYSIRSKQYRYTIWMKDNYRSTQPFDGKLVVATELYDYKNDPLETVNVVNEKKYAPISKKMNKQILVFFKTQQQKK
jgi:iduronate 2-sulfatase